MGKDVEGKSGGGRASRREQVSSGSGRGELCKKTKDDRRTAAKKTGELKAGETDEIASTHFAESP